MSESFGETRAEEVAALLVRRDCRLVIAESCTGGQVAAWLAGVPGISDHFCGSSVVYREATKSQWLGVPSELLATCSAVSPEVTRCLARQVLYHTAEAQLGVAVTGHLGPNSPQGLDGRIFLALATRSTPDAPIRLCGEETYQLQTVTRVARQQEAAGRVLSAVQRHLRAERDEFGFSHDP